MYSIHLLYSDWLLSGRHTRPVHVPSLRLSIYLYLISTALLPANVAATETGIGGCYNYLHLITKYYKTNTNAATRNTGFQVHSRLEAGNDSFHDNTATFLDCRQF